MSCHACGLHESVYDSCDVWLCPMLLLERIRARTVIDENTGCWNPDHLEPVTAQENTRRHFSQQTHCKNGHPLEVLPYLGREGRRGCRVCRSAAAAAATKRRRQRTGGR